MTLARTLPPDAYRPGPDDHQRELSFLKSQWLILCHEGAVPEPGDNFAFDILGCPILVRREGDGNVVAFLNACPHRGGPLAWPGRSRTRLLQCRYHGWTFRGDGSLIEPVGFGEGRSEIHCAGLGTRRLPVENRGGLILARLAAAGVDAPTLPAELTSRLTGSTLVSSELFRAKCNWKLYAENWLEAYHIRSLHEGLSNDIQGETYRVSCGPVWTEHSALPDKGTYGGYWAFLYPATAINFFFDGFSIEQISPASDAVCEVRYQFYQFGGKGEADGIEAEIELTRTVTTEDIAAAEHVQKCIDASIFGTGYVSKDREPGILAFYAFLSELRGNT